MGTRREFLDALAVGAAGLAVGITAKSYGQILGSNDMRRTVASRICWDQPDHS